MRQFNLRLLLPLIAALLLPAAVQAGMYKWVDPQGVTHYGDQPPPGQSAQPLAPPPGPASSAPAEEKALKQRTEAFDKAREERQKAAAEESKTKEQEARQAEQCRQIQASLETLHNRRRVQQVVNGEVVTMTDEARAAEIQRLEKMQQKTCQGQ